MIDNQADIEADGTLRFERPGVVLSKSSSRWVAAAIDNRPWSIVARLRPFAVELPGKARILSLSLTVYQRNFAIVQKGRDMAVLLRTTMTNQNGRQGGRPYALIHDVFQSNRWIDLELRAGPDQFQVLIDKQVRFETELPPYPFIGWDRSYSMLIGNEATFNRPWLGELQTLQIRTPDGVINGLDPASLEIPASYLFMTNYPKLVPFRDFSRRDAWQNFVMYIPIGLLFGLCCRASGWWFPGLAILLVVGMSLILETSQLFISTRNPSIDDLLLNSLGGTFGVLCAAPLWWLWRLPKCQTYLRSITRLK